MLFAGSQGQATPRMQVREMQRELESDRDKDREGKGEGIRESWRVTETTADREGREMQR